jgi:hypothetical protein
MRRALTLLVGAGVACGLAGAASSTSAGRALQAPHLRCLAARVSGDEIHVGPFKGGIFPAYDVVDGRFRLHVGAYRDRATGLTQKIPWFVPRSYRVGIFLVVHGRRLIPPRGTFTQRFPEAGNTDSSDQHVFPSTLRPPSSGCWRLTFRSGRTGGSIIARVDR